MTVQNPGLLEKEEKQELGIRAGQKWFLEAKSLSGSSHQETSSASPGLCNGKLHTFGLLTVLLVHHLHNHLDLHICIVSHTFSLLSPTPFLTFTYMYTLCSIKSRDITHPVPSEWHLLPLRKKIYHLCISFTRCPALASPFIPSPQSLHVHPEMLLLWNREILRTRHLQCLQKGRISSQYLV